MSAVKERPILFSGAMVRALLSGAKTQTRRVVGGPWKVEPESDPRFPSPHPWRVHRASCEKSECDFADAPPVFGDDQVLRCGGHELSFEGRASRSPYGSPGHRLWVKETWRPEASRSQVAWNVTYAADQTTWVFSLGMVPETWRMPKAAVRGSVSPLLMARWASRILLEVMAVRVERVRDITETDAVAEGIERTKYGKWTDYSGGAPFPRPQESYRSLWESINGAESWAANPWCWVITFKKLNLQVQHG